MDNTDIIYNSRTHQSNNNGIILFILIIGYLLYRYYMIQREDDNNMDTIRSRSKSHSRSRSRSSSRSRSRSPIKLSKTLIDESGIRPLDRRARSPIRPTIEKDKI
jgi:hypothetical protein